MEQYDNRVDAYINRSADFAKPLLIHIRRVVHEASPLLSETLKWGFPFFEYKGPVCQMAAFKKHAAFGFWKASRLNDPHHLLNPGEETAAGSFGKIYSTANLPAEDILKAFVLQAIALNESGEKVKIKKTPVEKAFLVIPDFFTVALAQDKQAQAYFQAFSPSQKREYVEWVLEAKTESTRNKRLQTALEWIGEGKIRNWKYK